MTNTVLDSAAETLVTRILIVDDDPDINRLLRSRLSAGGYQTQSAFSGEEALLQLDSDPPDILLLDISMPGMSGLEVLDRVRSLELDIAVVMTTAFGAEAVAVEALRRGADDYLRKPFEPDEFRAVLERTAAGLWLRRQNAVLRDQLDEKRRQLEAELTRAAEVQSALLPTSAPLLPGYQLAARCLSAGEVGGDFYDWYEPAAGVLTLTLGDVMGKGMPAALLMATLRAALRAVATEEKLASGIELVRRALALDWERSGSFCTVFQARLHIASGVLNFVDAGHGHVFLLRDGRLLDLQPRGLPLGVAGDAPYEEGALILAPGDTLIVYSDGLIDGERSSQRSRQGLADRLRGCASAAEMVSRLMDVAGPDPVLRDDMTVVVLQRLKAVAGR